MEVPEAEPEGACGDASELDMGSGLATRRPGGRRVHAPRAHAVASRFRVEALLGRGGMGTVERVVDTMTGQALALKRLRLDECNPKRQKHLLRLFEQEFHVLSQLDHPRIIKAYDYGTDDEGPYYTMEVLDGQDLTGMVPLSYREACSIARDVASSLAMVHNRGFVHRDVTPHNIRCNQDGQAKLLDFGAMCPMGIAPNVVGTPPFIPPESAQYGALDGRADLFSLGATLYFCLTGRHAYAARKVAQLPDLWRSPVVPPRQRVNDVPAALDDLVMELLSQSPLGRPQDAAAVFERLVTIGELPRDESLEVRSAYLTSPRLVGRQEEESRYRAALFQASQGKGRAVWIEGRPGLGRSRLLDQVVLEAKMMGFTVVRADAANGSREFGVLRRLVRGLLKGRPDLALHAAKLSPLLDDAPIPLRQRDELLGDVRAFLRGPAQHTKLAFAVDDVHLIDEPSLAGLAALADGLRSTHTLLVLTADPAVTPASQAATQILRTSAKRVGLSPLDDRAARELLASVFGNADNLDVLTTVLQRHSSGNPASLMRAAQALVDASVVRYAAGAWVLPATVRDIEAAVPRDVTIAERLAALQPDARQLITILATDHHRQLGTGDHPEVLPWKDPQRTLTAVDGLVATGLLGRSRSGVPILRPDHARAIVEALPQEEVRWAHARLAALYRAMGRVPAEAHHAARAGDWDRVEQLALQTPDPEFLDVWRQDPTAIETLEELIRTRQAQNPGPTRLRVRCRLLSLCGASEEWVRLASHGPRVVTDLADRCGLLDYERLAHLPADERLREAIARAETRAQANQEGEHPDEALSLPEAMQQLPTVLLGVAATASLAADASLATALPSLCPLFPLSPAFPLVERIRIAITNVACGHIAPGLRDFRGIDEDLRRDDTQLEPRVRAALEAFSAGFLQAIEITMGLPTVLERVEQSQRRSPKRAAREVYAYYTAIGDMDQACEARAKLERLEVQAGTLRHFPTCWESEYSLHSLTHHVEGLRRCEQEAERVARDLPGWAPRVELARISRAQCGDTSEETLQRARQLVESLAPGNDRRYALYLFIHGLLALGRYEEARQRMQAEIDALGRRPEWHEGYDLFLATAEAHLGMHEEARKHADAHMEVYLGAGVEGLLRGRMHEYVATIALLAGDHERFREHAEQCAIRYRNGYNPALTRRYEALMRRAMDLNAPVGTTLAEAAQFEPRTSASQLCHILRTELATIVDAPGRFRQALAMLTSRTETRGAALYLSTAAGLRCVAEIGDCPDPSETVHSIEAFWQLEVGPEPLHTITVDEAESEVTHLYRLELNDGVVHLALLCDEGDDGQVACGVVAMLASKGATMHAQPDAIAAMSRLMLEEDGIQPVVLEF